MIDSDDILDTNRFFSNFQEIGYVYKNFKI